jgi:hypothetical protein
MSEGPGWATPDPQQQPPQASLPAYPSAPPPGGPPWSGGAPKPGVIPLRPLGLSEMLDGAISTMRAHPKVILGFSAIVVTVSQLLSAAVTYPLLDDVNRAANLRQGANDDEILSAVGASFSVLGINLVIVLLSRVLLSGFLTVAVGKAVLGHPISFADVWERVRPRLWALLGLTMIYPAVVVVVVVLLVLVAIVAPGLAIVLIVVAIPVAIWLFIMFSLATPALMLENAPIGTAFGRSRALVRGAWWRTFGIQLLAGIIAGIVAAIITVPFTFATGGFDSTPPEVTIAYLAINTIGAIIAGTITEPFASGVTVLVYTDRRMRVEGMDIELARAAGVAPPPPPPYPA